MSMKRPAKGGKEEAAIALEGANLDRSRSILDYSKKKPVTAGDSKAPAGTSSSSITIESGAIVVNSAPGMDVGALADEVLRRFEKLIAQRKGRSFSDVALAR